MNWFAIRVSYSRELALKAILDAEKIENFIPMRYEYVIKSGKRVRRLLPAIHNLVFVHSTRKRIDALKDELESSMPIRFIMNREFCRPVVIPDAQMRSFILVAGSHEEAILYVEPAERKIFVTKSGKPLSFNTIKDDFTEILKEFLRKITNNKKKK